MINKKFKCMSLGKGIRVYYGDIGAWKNHNYTYVLYCHEYGNHYEWTLCPLSNMQNYTFFLYKNILLWLKYEIN